MRCTTLHVMSTLSRCDKRNVIIKTKWTIHKQDSRGRGCNTGRISSFRNTKNWVGVHVFYFFLVSSYLDLTYSLTCLTTRETSSIASIDYTYDNHTRFLVPKIRPPETTSRPEMMSHPNQGESRYKSTLFTPSTTTTYGVSRHKYSSFHCKHLFDKTTKSSRIINKGYFCLYSVLKLVRNLLSIQYEAVLVLLPHQYTHPTLDFPLD